MSTTSRTEAPADIEHPDQAVVTGAFSYTGGYIARRLIAQGVGVGTLTRHPDIRADFGGKVAAFPFNFSEPESLRNSMRGAGVLYNTYWIRFPRGSITFDHAVENSRILFQAAQKAGIKRIVHLSVSNASLESALPYIRAKAQVEGILADTGVQYAIIRPTLIFGAGDLLLNNMAWALRRFPIYPVFGRGDYSVQPVYAGDVADQTVEAGSQPENSIADAAGPETFSYEQTDQAHRSRGRRSESIGAPTAVDWTRYDEAGEPDGARRCANPQRGARADGWPVHIRGASDRHDQAEPLAPRTPRCTRSEIHL